MLSLLFSHLAATRVGFPFMLPELQHIIADYAQPERSFMGVTADASQPGGWRVERMDGNELRERLLQPRMKELEQQQQQQQQGAAAAASVTLQEEHEERVAELKSRTPDDLLTDHPQSLSGVQFVRHVSRPTSIGLITLTFYPRLPFDYCIELNGVDRVYCRHASGPVARHMQTKLSEEQELGSAARCCELAPYLQLLFRHAHEELGLPELDDGIIGLIGDYTCSPPADTAPYVFSFPSFPLLGFQLLVEREPAFCERMWPVAEAGSHFASLLASVTSPFAAVAHWLLSAAPSQLWTRTAAPARSAIRRPGPCKRRKWKEPTAGSTELLSFLRAAAAQRASKSPHAPPQFSWLIRGGAFDQLIIWDQVSGQ